MDLVNFLSVIARPGYLEYTGIRLAGQSRGKPFYLLWILVPVLVKNLGQIVHH